MYASGLSVREAAQAINEINENIVATAKANQEKAYNEANERANERDYIIEQREILRDANRNYKEFVTTDLLETAFKAIYITALQENSIIESKNIAFAEKLVDKFVTENGTYAILRKMGGKTYLLDTLKAFVEDAAEDAAEKADESDKEFEQVPNDSKEDMLQKMEDEEEVNDAVKLISDRIAAAEEEFIKKNLEDKKKIEDIVNGINDRIQAVKDDLTKDDETKEAIEQECTIEKNKQISDVYEERTHSIFDHMVHETAKVIYKDSQLRDVFTESGKVDMNSVVDTCKCMYGFLEFVNTLCLEKVDKTYIEKVIAEL